MNSAPGFDEISRLNDASTRVQVRSSYGSHLLEFLRTYPPTLTTTAFYRRGSELVYDLLLKADPEGPTFITREAVHTRN